ncbi:MAG: hypothetical protein LBE12_05370 [Planctomycetaceae bacterium]|jgi:hypothetical protein|nr:hypothetical protein [Planctomycetaceae bacterium]
MITKKNVRGQLQIFFMDGKWEQGCSFTFILLTFMFHYCSYFFIVFLLVCPVFAQPDLSKPLGTTIADTGSKFYRFEKFELDSDDKERHYKIVVAIPKAETPEKGFPIIYLLDGNSVLATLNDHFLYLFSSNTINYQLSTTFWLRRKNKNTTE